MHRLLQAPSEPLRLPVLHVQSLGQQDWSARLSCVSYSLWHSISWTWHYFTALYFLSWSCLRSAVPEFLQDTQQSRPSLTAIFVCIPLCISDIHAEPAQAVCRCRWETLEKTSHFYQAWTLVSAMQTQCLIHACSWVVDRRQNVNCWEKGLASSQW